MSKQWRFMLATVIVCSLAVTMLPAQNGSEPGEASGFETASLSAEQHLLAHQRIESGERFIEQQQFGLGRERRGEHGLHALTA